MVLAVIGRAWDDSRNIERLRSENDWVRRELLVALENHVPIVAVLVDRSDIPAFDEWESVLGARPPVAVRTNHLWDVEADPLAVVASVADHMRNGLQRTRTRQEMVEHATEAMIRHVLPGPQRAMGNAQLVAKVTADALGEDQWLRYVATGNSSGRPNGSAVVLLTRTQLDVVELGLDRPPLPLRLDELQG